MLNSQMVMSVDQVTAALARIESAAPFSGHTGVNQGATTHFNNRRGAHRYCVVLGNVVNEDLLRGLYCLPRMSTASVEVELMLIREYIDTDHPRYSGWADLKALVGATLVGDELARHMRVRHAILINTTPSIFYNLTLPTLPRWLQDIAVFLKTELDHKPCAMELDPTLTDTPAAKATVRDLLSLFTNNSVYGAHTAPTPMYTESSHQTHLETNVGELPRFTPREPSLTPREDSQSRCYYKTALPTLTPPCRPPTLAQALGMPEHYEKSLIGESLMFSMLFCNDTTIHPDLVKKLLTPGKGDAMDKLTATWCPDTSVYLCGGLLLTTGAMRVLTQHRKMLATKLIYSDLPRDVTAITGYYNTYGWLGMGVVAHVNRDGKVEFFTRRQRC